MKVAVKILPRGEVLDIQGRAVEKTLSQMGKKLNACSVGKYVVLDVPGENREKVLKEAKEMAEALLYNPLIETYQLDIL